MTRAGGWEGDAGPSSLSPPTRNASGPRAPRLEEAPPPAADSRGHRPLRPVPARPRGSVALGPPVGPLRFPTRRLVTGVLPGGRRPRLLSVAPEGAAASHTWAASPPTGFPPHPGGTRAGRGRASPHGAPRPASSVEAQTGVAGHEFFFNVSRQTRPDPGPRALRPRGPPSRPRGAGRLLAPSVPARGLIISLDVVVSVCPVAAGGGGHLPAEDRWPAPGPPSTRRRLPSRAPGRNGARSASSPDGLEAGSVPGPWSRGA